MIAGRDQVDCIAAPLSIEHWNDAGAARRFQV